MNVKEPLRKKHSSKKEINLPSEDWAEEEPKFSKRDFMNVLKKVSRKVGKQS